MLGYAWKTLGWFLASVAVALGFLLVPLQVAAERKKLDRTVSQIAEAHRDIRALETEFDTRANLAQLEKWNGDTLRLTAPVAAQFVPDTGALASLDVHQGASIQMASLVVPSLPDAGMKPAAPVVPAATAPVAAAAPTMTAAVAPVRDHAIARGKAQAIALLDRKLMSDSTIGDLLGGTRAEAGGAH
ncbi:hypothetical protein GCM10009087_16330 [Sphingomonas oligophenolica]|uniref:Cell division protein FtsL n=1 Tax=Sphingomonas oligophenolica TaxID=301154 RepID=A0ABU9Y833_9SPHN